MKIGIYNLTQYDESTDSHEVWTSIRDLALLIDKSGFDSLWIGEHHVTPDDQYLQNIPILSALASETQNVTIGAGAFLLPLHKPVHVAELGATIDAMSDGRLWLACGLGYRDEEFHAFEVNKENRVARLIEGIKLIRRLWTEDEVTFDGKAFQFQEVTINPKPVQDPSPPLLVAGFADKAGKRAAHIGDSWLFGNLADKSELERQFEMYHDEVAAAGREDTCFTPPVLREAFVLPDEEEAFETVEPYLKRKFESYSGWGLEGTDITNDFRSASEDRFIIGSPETVVQELQEYAELGVEHVILRVQYPGMEADDARRCIETIADEVIPDLP